MADHINIQHPEMRQRHRGDAIVMAELRARLQTIALYEREAEEDLDAIFTRIDDGKPVELHYPDGRVFIITGKERK